MYVVIHPPHAHNVPRYKGPRKRVVSTSLGGYNMQLCVVVCEILIDCSTVTPKRAGTNGSKINDVGISKLK